MENPDSDLHAWLIVFGDQYNNWDALQDILFEGGVVVEAFNLITGDIDEIFDVGLYFLFSDKMLVDIKSFFATYIWSDGLLVGSDILLQ